MEKINVTVRMDAGKVKFLDKLADTDDRDRSYLINEAVESYIAMRQWQIEEIKKGLAEADAGLFATDKEVERYFKKWTS